MADDDLDMSWINQHERIQNIQTNYYREPMETVNTYFIYINQNQYIDKILCEKYDLDINNGGSLLNKETLLKIIQNKKIKTLNTRYKLIDILQYHIDLEPEHIQTFINGEPVPSSQKKLKNISVFDEIVFSPSIFIFHSINSLYFIFQEVETVNTKNRKSLKSILKPDSNNDDRELSKKGTKKVKIATDNIEYTASYTNKNRRADNKTRKARPAIWT
jgi:hypothetical protein